MIERALVVHKKHYSYKEDRYPQTEERWTNEEEEEEEDDDHKKQD